MGNYVSTIAGQAPAVPAATHGEPLRVNLFDVHVGVEGRDEKPRSATSEEMRVYLLDLARWRGITVPGDARVADDGIYSGADCIVPMPGYGADNAVIMEELDEAGEVVRTSRIGVDRKGCIGLKADAVRKVAALPKVTKPRATKAKAVAVPVETPAVEAPAADATVVTLQATVAELLARVDALTEIVASRPTVEAAPAAAALAVEPGEDVRDAYILQLQAQLATERGWQAEAEDAARVAQADAAAARTAQLEAERERDAAIVQRDASRDRVVMLRAKRHSTAKRMVAARDAVLTFKRVASQADSGRAIYLRQALELQAQVDRYAPLAAALAGLANMPSVAAPAPMLAIAA